MHTMELLKGREREYTLDQNIYREEKIKKGTQEAHNTREAESRKRV